MEHVLKTIAKQANLDRILFTPALKKLYFTMAMASGGATQFKHAETLRKGLLYAADKATDKKHTLLFCSVHEIPEAYDLLLQFADQLTPVIILALRDGTEESGYAFWSHSQLAGTGWIQFHTHTRQELYNHLALGYYLFEEKKVHVPVLVIHSSASHECLGDYIPKEDINLGNPLLGLQSSRATKKLDFDAALAAVKHKKEKPSLRKIYENLVSVLREGYTELGYQLPENGLPFAGMDSGSDWAVITAVPPYKEENRFYRLLCYRPFSIESLLPRIKDKTRIIVVEPRPAPGVEIPPFFGEIRGYLPFDSGLCFPVCTARDHGVLSPDQSNEILSLAAKKEIPSPGERKYLLL